MTEPRWLSLEVVLAIHEAQLSEHGGSLGLRDRGLLESALDRPRQIFGYGTRVTLSKLAAAYAVGLARNHPFVNGNKKTAWVVCAAFLDLNGREVTAKPADVVTVMLDVAGGRLPELQLAAWLTENSHP